MAFFKTYYNDRRKQKNIICSNALPSSMRSEEILGRFTEGLQSGKLLPAGVTARIIQTDLRLPIDSHDLGVDLVAEFEIIPAGKRILTAIECKSRLSPTTVEPMLFRLNQARTRLQTSTRSQELKLLIAAPYLSPGVRERCRELNIGYLDLNGTFFLADDGVFIDVVRPATAYRIPQGVKNVFAGKSRRVIRVLLANAYRPFRLDELAAETKLSTSQIFQVFNNLHEYRGLIDRTPAGRALVRPGRLLRTLATEIKSDYQQNRKIFPGLVEHPEMTLQRVADISRQRGDLFAATLHSGLEPYERNTVENVAAAYIASDPEDIARSLDIPFATLGANFLLMQPPFADNTDAGGVFYGTRTLTNGLRAVNPVQAFLDFSLYPTRGEEQARFIQERVLSFPE